jgi:16S rRNA (cytosine1402-N4)-methyltransferase
MSSNINTELSHAPVLPLEVLEGLQPAPGKTILDATLGGAGHTRLLLGRGANVSQERKPPEPRSDRRQFP